MIARQVVEPGTSTLARIEATFGKQVLFPDGTLDRKKLGSIIFTDESKRKKLNAIVHPAVRRTMLWQVLGYWIKGYKYCVLDVPLLIEGGLWWWVGSLVVVYWYGSNLIHFLILICLNYCSSEELQLQRLMDRDNSSREDALARLGSQLPVSEKVTYADIVIDNSGSKLELEDKVDALISRLEKEVGWTWRVSWIVPVLGLIVGLWVLLERRRVCRRKPKNV